MGRNASQSHARKVQPYDLDSNYFSRGLEVSNSRSKTFCGGKGTRTRERLLHRQVSPRYY